MAAFSGLGASGSAVAGVAVGVVAVVTGVAVYQGFAPAPGTGTPAPETAALISPETSTDAQEPDPADPEMLVRTAGMRQRRR